MKKNDGYPLGCGAGGLGQERSQKNNFWGCKLLIFLLKAGNTTTTTKPKVSIKKLKFRVEAMARLPLSDCATSLGLGY